MQQPEPRPLAGHIPDHSDLVPDEIHDLIRRAHWQSAKSTEDVAPHQYVVLGWDKDDLTDQEFWFFVATIKSLGREEVWTPPDEWVRRWGGRAMRSTYLYVFQHAYWFTYPRNRVPMLNREHVWVQQDTPTRRAGPDSGFGQHERLPEPDQTTVQTQLSFDQEEER